MQGQVVEVFRILMSGPADAAGLIELIESGRIDPATIVAILGKTEGNGGVNDFTREYATVALCTALAPHLGIPPADVEERIAFVMSGGTEGVLSPHITVFTQKHREISLGSVKRLSIGVATTRAFLPEELGRTAQVEETAAAMRLAMERAGISDPADVHFVQVKCPLLTADRIKDAHRRHKSTATKSSYGSMAFSRGASALGIALALGEVSGPIAEDQILNDWSLYSSVASTSAGIELTSSVLIVMGNSLVADSDYIIGHAVMRDAIDIEAVITALSSTGLSEPGTIGRVAAERLVNVFAKAESSPDGLVRGFRHTMLDDTDISATRHARAAVGGLIAGLSGHGAVYVSGGAEHQGPPGGGPVAVIAAVGGPVS